MNLSENSMLLTVYPLRFNLIKSIICGLALLASGQAMATMYWVDHNISDLTTPSNWLVAGGCMGSTYASSPITFINADTLILCAVSVNPPATDIATVGTIQFLSGSSWGSLRFNSNNKTITHSSVGNLGITTLDLSSMTVNNTITISAPSGGTVSFNDVTNGALSCGGSAYTPGNTISDGTVCTVTAVTPPPPSAPTGLTATVASTTQINLIWTDNSSDESGFKIFNGATLLTTTAANATSYNATGLTCNTAYTFTVKATNANGDSTAAATTPATTTTSACSSAVSAPIFDLKPAQVFATEVEQ